MGPRFLFGTTVALHAVPEGAPRCTSAWDPLAPAMAPGEPEPEPIPAPARPQTQTQTQRKSQERW